MESSIYRFFLIILFISFALGLQFCSSFSLVAASRGYSLLWCEGFSLWWLLSLWSTGSRVMSPVVVAPGLGSCDVLASLLCSMWESSQIRDRIHVSCIERWILYDWSTRQAPCIYCISYLASFFHIILRIIHGVAFVNNIILLITE